MSITPINDETYVRPIIFYDEYDYCCNSACYCMPCCVREPWCMPCFCCFAHPDPTLAWTQQINKDFGMFGEDKPLISYRFWHHATGFNSVEVFRNAAAVDTYHKKAASTGCCLKPCGLPACVMLSLACRTIGKKQETYGDLDEVKKVTFDFGRCQQAVKAGKLMDLPGEGSHVNIQDKFGPYHFGWVEDLKGVSVPSIAPIERF